MTTPEDLALNNARKSLANDIELEMDLLSECWVTFGHIFEILELDFELRGEEIESTWSALALSWRNIVSDRGLKAEQISKIWLSVLNELQSLGPETIELITTLDATKLMQKCLLEII
jgi:hypothetical protein